MHVSVDSIVLTPDESEVLLIKRSPKITHGNKWGFPGGFLDRDETVYEGMKREIKEETGHNIHDIKVFRIISDPDRGAEDRQNVVFVFVAKAEKQQLKLDWESTEAKWIKISEIPDKKDFAFDHFDSLDMYLNSGVDKNSFPIIE